MFENEASDENVERVLDLVERLDRNVGVVNLTLNDLELAVDILNSTVAFLTQHLKNGGSDFSNQVSWIREFISKCSSLCTQTLVSCSHWHY